MQVLQSDEEVQRNIAPFLKSKILREIVRSFTRNNDFEQWAQNTQVLNILREAQRLLDNGYVTEQQLQKSLLAHLEVCCMCWLLMSQYKACDHYMGATNLWQQHALLFGKVEC